MTDLFDWGKLDEWINAPCISCTESSSNHVNEHVGMGVSRPVNVDSYLEGIAGPNEMHESPTSGNCINPKCYHNFDQTDISNAEWDKGWINCPECGIRQNLLPGESRDTQTYVPDDDGGKAKLNPGGITRSGLTLAQMGTIGEEIVLRMGELPGVGAVSLASTDYNHPIDAIVQGSKGKFGCEIKSNHSQAQERFKVGGKEERRAKITYCLTHGLKPALIGVRLNFYTDKAYIFFREGLTDTWYGNSKMLHVATVDFADLNPFKSPDQQAQALAVENADLPDQSDDEFGDTFGSKVASDEDQPRDDEGKFTFKKDVHELKVQDKHGKHLHTVKRCKHCGTLYGKKSDHEGRIECPTCGEDPERKLKVAKVILGGPSADEYAKQFGFAFFGRNSQGHRQYKWQDEDGTQHVVGCGSGAHGKRAAELDADFARQRMQKCASGKCNHIPLPAETNIVGDPEEPVFKIGQTVQTGGDYGIVKSIDDGEALIQNFSTGQPQRVPVGDIKAAATDGWA